MQKDELEIVTDDHRDCIAPDIDFISPALGDLVRLPDFVGIGVQKGGTTTLHRLLRTHPGVAVSPVKELQFFTLHFSRGVAWYANQFAAADPGQRIGEITPYYVFHPEAAGRIHALLPQIKLIVLLRDPVERSLSQYFHSRRLGLEPLGLEEALAVEPQRLADASAVLAAPDGRHRSHQEHSYLSRSRYEQQLPLWYGLFGPDQLLVLRSELLFRKPELLWDKVQHFLGLERLPLPDVACQRFNAGMDEAIKVPEPIADRLRQALASTYRWMEQELEPMIG